MAWWQGKVTHLWMWSFTRNNVNLCKLKRKRNMWCEALWLYCCKRPCWCISGRIQISFINIIHKEWRTRMLFTWQEEEELACLPSWGTTALDTYTCYMFHEPRSPRGALNQTAQLCWMEKHTLHQQLQSYSQAVSPSSPLTMMNYSHVPQFSAISKDLSLPSTKQSV